MFKAVPEGAVLFSTTDEVYFGLNDVGARIWASLPPATRTLDELTAAIAREYPDATETQIRADVTELLAELEAHGLVTGGAVSNVGAADGTPPQAR